MPANDSPISAAAKWARQKAGLAVAHEAVLLDDAKQLLASDRDATRAHQQQTNPPAAGGEGDGMIHVGDQTIHQHVPPPPASSVPRLLAAAALAGLGLGGAGLGAGAAAYLLRPAAPAATAPGAPAPPPPKTEEVELQIRWWVEDGAVKTDVQPVPKGK